MRQRSLASGRTAGGLTIALATVLIGGSCEREETAGMSGSTGARRIAATIGKASASGKVEKAMFGAGCFWGVEAAFRRVEGVTETAVGYSGGKTKDPTYRDVCTGTTGHAEVVQVTFDPERVSYDQLLDVFWSCHDPTTPNRQGPDVGEQYRSAIFFHSPEQEAAAKASKDRLERSGRLRRPIVTQIVPASEFYRAEEYHQQYAEKHGGAACPTGH